MKLAYLIFGILLLTYLILPGPTSINDFPAVPTSTKSTEDGDVWQVPNIAGYYSNVYRGYVTNFYRQAYQAVTWLPFVPMRLNHPPEFSYEAIKDQTQSTYLEEMVYPMRDSLFVNGMEPFEEDTKEPRYPGATKLGNEMFETKTTIRFYPSNPLYRIVVWGGVMVSIYLLWRLGRKAVYA